MSLNLYFLRHGETTASQTGGYSGAWIPISPNRVIIMARDFAAAYKDHPFVPVHVSPMRRTRATVGPLCELAGHDMLLRDGLRELDYGEWEGKTPEQVDKEHTNDYSLWLADAGWNAPTGGERGMDVGHRSLWGAG